MPTMKSLFFTLIAGMFLATLSLSAPDENKAPSTSPGNRIFEMRTYHTNDGKLEALHSRFRDHTNGLFVKYGITLVGYWVPEGKDNTLVYILAYPSMDARKKSWKAFGSDPAWRKAYKASIADGKLVNKVDSQFLRATDYSPIQ